MDFQQRANTPNHLTLIVCGQVGTTRREITRYESNASSFSSPRQNLFSADSTVGEPSTNQPTRDVVAPTDEGEQDFSDGKSGRFGRYFIISPGASFPFKQHESESGATPSLRKYVPGFSTNLATGFETDSYRIGLGAMYRTNSHDGESYYDSSVNYRKAVLLWPVIWIWVTRLH